LKGSASSRPKKEKKEFAPHKNEERRSTPKRSPKKPWWGEEKRFCRFQREEKKTRIAGSGEIAKGHVVEKTLIPEKKKEHGQNWEGKSSFRSNQGGGGAGAKIKSLGTARARKRFVWTMKRDTRTTGGKGKPPPT